MRVIGFWVLTLNLRLRPESTGSFGNMEKLALKRVILVEEDGCLSVLRLV